ncbi:MAG TPA: thiamine phosphate synthase [Burkholderiales bacterium]|nr:thiamine phosphate synthase [Burkholderiales bacterium]
MSNTIIQGLYAITPDLADSTLLFGKVEAALAGGARALQYRNKTADPALRLEQARGLARLCRGYHVPLIINDHVDLALEVDAEGLHIGGEDGSVADARRRLGPDRILGVSCYRAIENALAAARLGATYVAFGGFFPSSVKGGSGGAPLSILGEAKRRPGLPVVAIGGITVDNAPQLIAAGADSISVITALFSAPDVRAAAQQFSALFGEKAG